MSHELKKIDLHFDTDACNILQNLLKKSCHGEKLKLNQISYHIRI